jgi:hypothetical protein
VQIERAVREPAMQVHRRRDDGGLRHQERAENVQEWSKHLLDLSGPSRNQPVRHEQRNRSQNRHNEPHRIPWAVPPDGAAKEAADDGPHNAHNDRYKEAARVSSGHEELGNDTNDEAEDDPTYDSHDVLLL